MPQGDTVWTSLEIAKLAIAALVPVSVGLLGWFINKRFKQLEEIQWKSRKAIEKRIEIFDRLAPDVNRLYCYFVWVGPWQEIAPKEVIALKRALDHGFYVNRYLIGEEVFRAYQSFVGLLFQTYAGAGRDALIRTLINGPDGDRRESSHYKWERAWAEKFDESDVADQKSVHVSYVTVMRSFKTSIGL